jgi:hypothetical protein
MHFERRDNNMGMHNLKFEAEVFTLPTLQVQGGITPVETKPDFTLLNQIASQLGQLTVHVNQLTQTVAAQTFTRSVQQAGAEPLNAAEEIRKLTQRLDDLESRLPKGK